MSAPFFTIAIPTKNRPDRIGNAVKSVLDQTFKDFELVVCDNSDEREANLTRAIVDDFSDPRIRYIRTSGQLSMADNWDAAIADGYGKYVGILTDRSVYRRDALRIARSEIENTGARLVSWYSDLYNRDGNRTFQRRSGSLKRYFFYTGTVLTYFLNGHPKFAPKIIPKLMTGVCERKVLDKIRASPVGRCCPPVSPDFTSGFLMLAHCEWVLMLDEALYVSCGRGNGSAFRRRDTSADRFREDLGMEWGTMVDRTPSPACFSFGVVLNDFLRIRELLPDLLPQLEINRTQYYQGCLYDYVKVAGLGDRSTDLELLLDSLSKESERVQQEVRATKVYRAALDRSQSARRRATKDSTVGEGGGGRWPRFDTVFEALAWSEAHPSERGSHTFLEFMPSYADRPTFPRGGSRRAAKEAARNAAKNGTASKPTPLQPHGGRRRVPKVIRHQVVLWRSRGRRARALVDAAMGRPEQV
jgi:hypothetical protein